MFNKIDYLINSFNLLLEERNVINADELLSFLLKNINSANHIITEEIKKFIQLPEQLIQLIKENLSNDVVKIDGEDISACFEDKQIFKTTLLPDIYISKFNFSNFDEFEKFILQMSNELNLSEKQIYALTLIQLRLKSVNGLFTDFNKIINGNLLLFNSETHTDRTIEHELTHYLQKYTKYGLSKVNLNQHIDYSKFDYLKLTQQELVYLIKNILNQKELVPTVDNLIDILNKLYEKWFKNNESEQDFLKRFISICGSKNEDIIFASDIYEKWKNDGYSLVPMYMYCILPEVLPKMYAKINLNFFRK